MTSKPVLLNAFRIKWFSKINRWEWDPKSDLLAKTQRPVWFALLTLFSRCGSGHLDILWNPQTCWNLPLSSLQMCAFFFFFPFRSFYGWPFPISGIQKDLTDHLKVAFSSLFSLCILFVSFTASQQFAAILYPCFCCLLPPVQVHEASPCPYRPRAVPRCSANIWRMNEWIYEE